MIKIPNRQLPSLFFLPLFVFLALLAGFFKFAISAPPSFFVYIDAALGIILLYLLYARFQFTQKQAALELMKQDFIERSNLLQVETSKEKEFLEALRRKIENYSQLKGLTEKFSLCFSLRDSIHTLASEIAKVFDHEDITQILYLIDHKTRELGMVSSLRGKAVVNLKSKKGDIFDEWVFKTLQPLCIETTKSDFRFDFEKVAEEERRNVGSLVSVPLSVENKTLGILRLDFPLENYFTIEDLRLLTTIGDLAAITLENAELYERIEEFAVKDSLTGLFLRRYLLTRLSEEISRQLRRKQELSFLMIDLDKFKNYNDQFGHMAGDIVLRTIGMLLSDYFKDPGTLVCRYGGEEFAVLLPDCPKTEAMRLAEGIRKKIQKQEIILRKEKTHITVSIGIATFPGDAQMKDELIHKADGALYKAKSEGRNRVSPGESSGTKD